MPSKEYNGFTVYTPEGGLSAAVNRDIRDPLAPTTKTWGEAVTRVTPYVGDAWAVDDLRKDYAQNGRLDPVKTGITAALSLAGMGGLSAIAGPLKKKVPLSQAGAFIGELGARKIPAVAESQAYARQLRQQGVPDEVIWRLTGDKTGYPSTFNFKHGQVSTEIDDSLVKFNTTPLKMSEYQRALGEEELQKFYNHAELFKAYPSLATEPLLIMERGGLGRGVEAGRGKNFTAIDVEKTFYPREAKSLLAHEIQHAIDRLEGVGGGANNLKLSRQIRAAYDPFLNANEMLDIAHIAKTRGISLEKAAELWKKQLQDEIKSAEPTLARLYKKAPIYSDPEYQQNTINMLLRNGEKWFKDMLHSHVYPKIKDTGGWSSREAYEKTAGEVDARLAGERAWWSQEKRNDSYPWKKGKEGQPGFISVPKEQQFLRDPETYENLSTEAADLNHPYGKVYLEDGEIVHKSQSKKKFAEGGVVKAQPLIEGLSKEQIEDLLVYLHSDEPQKFAEGGLVGQNPFTSTTQGLFGQMDLVHPKNTASAPLDISLNTNNMMATSRAGTPQSALYRTR